jgi:hypothetical protein
VLTPGAHHAQAIKFILKHGKSEKDIRALRQEIEILRGLQARRAVRPRAALGARAGRVRAPGARLQLCRCWPARGALQRCACWRAPLALLKPCFFR